jgi:hypothetical protein
MASVTQKWTNIRSAALRTYTTSVEPLVMSAQRPDRHLVNFCLLVVHAILKSAMSLVESRVVNLYLRVARDFPSILEGSRKLIFIASPAFQRERLLYWTRGTIKLTHGF